jgi:transposase-like protein
VALLGEGGLFQQLITDVGPVPIEMPRNRDGTVVPRTVPRRQRRFGGVDNLVISLTAKG